MQKFDVIIIGSGPGGGMAACDLARAGMKILLLEKHALPRHKPCGGAMPLMAKTIIGWDFSAVIEREISTTRNLFDFERPVEQHGNPIVFVNRADFDYHLVQRAQLMGMGNVHVRDQFAVDHVEETSEGVYVYGVNGECLHAAYVVGADGAFSKTARSLGLNSTRRFAAAIDAEVEASTFEGERERVTFNYFCLPGGYGWVFPKGDKLTCGVVTWSEQRVSVQRALTNFLTRSFPSGSIKSVQTFGYPIPVYQQHAKIASRRVCLVGDAASLVDPILGEGIRYALISGRTAASVISRIMGAEENDEAEISDEAGCLLYQKLIQASMGKEFFALTKLIVPMYLRAPDYFYRKFVEAGYSYSNVSHIITNAFGFLNL